jgi:tetratricopeptide (TPR) repeat protein
MNKRELSAPAAPGASAAAGVAGAAGDAAAFGRGLAERLAACEDGPARTALLDAHLRPARGGVSALARELKDICLDAWTSDPARATRAALALEELAERAPDPSAAAHAAWASGVAALVAGRMRDALDALDDAARRFGALGRPDTAAATQVSKLYALAVLGRYDEALACGLQARETLLAHGDQLAAGRIEHNLGNLYQRRDRYDQAEEFLRFARERFAPAGDDKKLAQIDNCIAYALSFQHKFRAAEELYRQALERAEAAGLRVTVAEIESNLGYLALFQGRYARALEHLERSRRHYDALGMPHQSAVAEQEMADAYLELNLAPEAAGVYARVAPVFARLEMRAERARALAYHGRACLDLKRLEEAAALLAEAHDLYAAEENDVGVGIVALAQAQLRLARAEYAEAAAAASEAERLFAPAGAWGRLLTARWLRGEALRLGGAREEAGALFEATLRDAGARESPQIALRCHTSLGLLASSAGDDARAEECFARAVALVEELRAPLPAEEFRAAFFGDKLTPFSELARLCLSDPRGPRVREAFGYVERASARALLDLLDGRLAGAGGFAGGEGDAEEAALRDRLAGLREELNWLYSQINRPPQRERARSLATPLETLHLAARERERQALEVTRQLRSRRGAGGAVW